MNQRTLNQDLFSGKYRPRVEKTKRQRREAQNQKHAKQHLNRLKSGDFLFLTKRFADWYRKSLI